MISNPLPRLHVIFTPPANSSALPIRMQVVAFDSRGQALVVPVQSARAGDDRSTFALVPATSLLRLYGDDWVARMEQAPVPPSDIKLIGIVPGSSAPVEYTRSDGSLGIGIVSAWGVKEDSTMIALGVTERLTEVRHIERDSAGQIVGTHDEFEQGATA